MPDQPTEPEALLPTRPVMGSGQATEAWLRLSEAWQGLPERAVVLQSLPDSGELLPALPGSSLSREVLVVQAVLREAWQALPEARGMLPELP